MNTTRRYSIFAFAALLLTTAGDHALRQSQAQSVVQTLRTASVDTSEAETTTANFIRVRDTTEEFILDFGTNDVAPAAPSRAIEIEERIVLSPYTAKRLLIALEVTLGAHERKFGVIETDPNKRVKVSP
jgi:hypothetical protein